MTAVARQTTGIAKLDELLGGGLIPGRLNVVLGATGIGKTQFGIHFAGAGTEQDGRRGAIFDLCTRGDSQSHVEYAERMYEWKLAVSDPKEIFDRDAVFRPGYCPSEYLHLFEYSGRRVTRRDLDFDEMQMWQSELNTRLARAIGFFYGNFIHGCRRIVVDGFEPVDNPADSIQLSLFEYIYHQIVRKDPEWVARDLFRETYRQHAEAAASARYDENAIGCTVLLTSRETMLDDLIDRPLDEGDLLSNANTLIYLGKIREGKKISRAMYIMKHRGSACTDEIIPFTIDDRGLHISDTVRP